MLSRWRVQKPYGSCTLCYILLTTHTHFPHTPHTLPTHTPTCTSHTHSPHAHSPHTPHTPSPHPPPPPHTHTLHSQSILSVHETVRTRSYETPIPSYDPNFHPQTNYQKHKGRGRGPEYRTIGLHKSANEPLVSVTSHYVMNFDGMRV